MPSLLSVDGLCVSYQQACLVDNVTFELDAGEVLCVMGRSGAGKSLAMMSLIGICGEHFTVDGKAILSKKALPISRQNCRDWATIRGCQIGYIFQDPKRTLNPLHTVQTALKQALSYAHVPKKQQKKHIIELLTQVKVPTPETFLSRYPHQLSGGEAQRVAIALVLALNPSVVIADEPTSSLDTSLKDEILLLLKTIAKQQKRAVIIISHDIKYLGGVADKYILMSQGKMAWTAKHLIDRPKNDRVFGGHFDKSFDDVPVLLQIKDLTLSYKKSWLGRYAPFISGLNFTLKQGQIIGLIGASGRGKSSLAKAITRLDDRLVISGAIEFFDKKLGKQSVGELTGKELLNYRPKVLLMMQDIVGSLNPNFKIIDSLTEGLKATNKPICQHVIENYLALVNLPKTVLLRYPKALSGGECARVCLLRVLLMSPDVLILDEPTAMLDESTTIQVIELLKYINQTLGVAMLLISHDDELVQTLCHQVVSINKITL